VLHKQKVEKQKVDSRQEQQRKAERTGVERREEMITSKVPYARVWVNQVSDSETRRADEGGETQRGERSA
jgi:hypothetical protein